MSALAELFKHSRYVEELEKKWEDERTKHMKETQIKLIKQMSDAELAKLQLVLHEELEHRTLRDFW